VSDTDYKIRERLSARCIELTLFDHLVGAREDCLGDFQSQPLSSPEIHDTSYFVGCSTGRSAGLAPFKILPTYIGVSRRAATRSGP
jgi:hypothetical protein